MFRMLVAGVFALGVGEARAQLLSDGIGPAEIGPVSISLGDNAADACWTNLK